MKAAEMNTQENKMTKIITFFFLKKFALILFLQNIAVAKQVA